MMLYTYTEAAENLRNLSTRALHAVASKLRDIPQREWLTTKGVGKKTVKEILDTLYGKKMRPHCPLCKHEISGNGKRR